MLAYLLGYLLSAPTREYTENTASYALDSDEGRCIVDEQDSDEEMVLLAYGKVIGLKV